MKAAAHLLFWKHACRQIASRVSHWALNSNRRSELWCRICTPYCNYLVWTWVCLQVSTSDLDWVSDVWCIQWMAYVCLSCRFLLKRDTVNKSRLLYLPTRKISETASANQRYCCLKNSKQHQSYWWNLLNIFKNLDQNVPADDCVCPNCSSVHLFVSHPLCISGTQFLASINVIIK